MTSNSCDQKSYSPSFTSYLNTGLAHIALRVTNEFADLDDDNAYLFQYLEPEQPSTSENPHTQIRNHSCTDEESESDSKISHKQIVHGETNNNGDDEDEEEQDEKEESEESEFEFDLANLLPSNGDLGPVYPVFNRDLLVASYNQPVESVMDDSTSKVQIQLKKLFLDEHRDNPSTTGAASSSSSDSEGEELDSIPPGTYCVWTQPPLNRCTKSSSTGSAPSAASSSSAMAGKAKMFRLRDLLRRSKSDGKDGVVLITPLSKKKNPVGSGNTISRGATAAAKGKAVVGSGVRGSPARESYEYHYYRRGREGESGNTRRKSYLPYKQDLVGLFVTPHGLRKVHLPPFSPLG